MSHLHTVLFDGKVTPGHAEMTAWNQSGQEVEAFFEIQGKGIREEMLANDRWILPGLAVEIERAPAARVRRMDEQTVRVYCALPRDGEKIFFSMSFQWKNER